MIYHRQRMKFEIIYTRDARCVLFFTCFVFEKYSAYQILRIETGLYFQRFVIFDICYLRYLLVFKRNTWVWMVDGEKKQHTYTLTYASPTFWLYSGCADFWPHLCWPTPWMQLFCFPLALNTRENSERFSASHALSIQLFLLRSGMHLFWGLMVQWFAVCCHPLDAAAFAFSRFPASSFNN